MRRAIVIIGLLVLVLVACSDDGDEASQATGGTPPAAEADCDWPMWGHGIDRTFEYPCDSGISSDTVADLRRIWFFNTSDVVTAAPVVVDGRLFVGDWAGRFYALDAETGEEEWHFDTEPAPLVYAGQITSSATHTTIDDTDVVVFGGGRTVYVLDADDGDVVWTRELGGDDPGDPTEIEAPPLVVEDKVLVGYDVHNGPFQAGVLALDLATGDELWSFDPEDGDHRGCGDVWGGLSVDAHLQLAFVGTGSCPGSPEAWTDLTEAAIALDLGTGEVEWSFQPHEPNNDDLDFAGTPPLFSAGGRDLVGFGNKDAVYYALDRATGELVWSTKVTEPGLQRPGSNYSTGGFIGPAAATDGLIVGGTAVGDCPCMHALDAATGEIVWQQPVVGPTYAPTTVVDDVAFVGSLDFTLRALDVRSGEVLWSDELSGLVSGGVAAVGDDLWAVAGFREPGLDGPAETAGITRYTVDPTVESTDNTVPPITAPTGSASVRLVEPFPPECISEPCEIRFDLKEPPPGASPEATLTIEPDPFRVTIESSGLGDPAAWIQPGTPAADAGATAYGLFISERDDDPNGGFLCVLDDDGCTAGTVPRPGASYSRISVLAVVDAESVPSPADGFARLVATVSFDPPLLTEGAGGAFVLSGQGNDLVAYDLGTLDSQRVITNSADDPDGRDINGQLCTLADGRILTGEDTGQPNPPAGYGIFELTGGAVGSLGWEQVAKLTPTYQEAESQPENYGCGQLPDGRILTTDIGNQELGDGTGQLIVWFPPFEGDDVAYCKVDIEVATAQSLLVDGDDVLLASGRPPTAGVWRYSGDFPTGPDAAGGCGRTDTTGAPLVDADRVTKALLVPAGQHGLVSIVGLAPAPDEGIYVSSVISGVITEHDGDGTYRRTILEPPPGAVLAEGPYPGGTPLGLAVAGDGTLYYADLGVVIDDSGIGPGDRTGSVRRIAFVDGEPQPPELVESGLAFPDGVLVVGG